MNTWDDPDPDEEQEAYWQEVLAAKDAELERLREALRPFALDVTSEVGDDHVITIQWPDLTVTAGDFRRARTALGNEDPA